MSRLKPLLLKMIREIAQWFKSNGEPEHPFHIEGRTPVFDPPLTLEDKERAAEKRSERDYKNKQLSLQRHTLWTQILLVVFGVFGSGIGIYQARIAKVSSDTALLATKVTQQSAYDACLSAKIARSALIESQSSEVDAYGASKATVYQAMAAVQGQRASMQLRMMGKPSVELGNKIELPVNFFNEGKTSAENFTSKVRLVLLPSGQEPNFTYPKRQSAHGSAGRAEPGFSFDPSGPLLTVSVISPDGNNYRPTQTDLRDLQQGRKVLVAYASMSYTDMFGEHHWKHSCQPFQQFTEQLIKTTGLPKCAYYNETDKGSTLLKVPSFPNRNIAPEEITCAKPSGN